MGSFMVINGTVQVKACSEVTAIIESLTQLTEGLDEQEIICEPVADSSESVSILDIDINLLGDTSASTSSAIQTKTEEFGHYATEGARFTTEWEGRDDYFFVGSEEQIAVAKSLDALQQIRGHAFNLGGADILSAIQYLIQDAQFPQRKHDYLNASDSICPFCQSEESLKIHFLHTKGYLARSRVQCESCQYTWLGHYRLVDMTQVREANGKAVKDATE